MTGLTVPGPIVSETAVSEPCRPVSDAIHQEFATHFVPGPADVLVALGVAAMAALSLLVLTPGQADPIIWPANALPIAYLLAPPRPPSWQSGLTIVALAACGTLLGTLAAGLAFSSAVVTALVAAANIAISTWAGRSLPGPRPGITRMPAIFKLGVGTALAGPAAGALVAMLAMRVAGIATPASFAASTLGALLYVPACMTLAGGRRRLRRGSSLVPDDPAGVAALLRAQLLDKALYELRYELANRPEWLHLPLLGLRFLLGSAGS